MNRSSLRCVERRRDDCQGGALVQDKVQENRAYEELGRM